MAAHPAAMTMARFPMARHPDEVVAVTAPEAGLPFEITARTARNDFAPERRRAAMHIKHFRLRGRDCCSEGREGQSRGGEQNLNAFHDFKLHSLLVPNSWLMALNVACASLRREPGDRSRCCAGAVPVLGRCCAGAGLVLGRYWAGTGPILDRYWTDTGARDPVPARRDFDALCVKRRASGGEGRFASQQPKAERAVPSSRQMASRAIGPATR